VIEFPDIAIFSAALADPRFMWAVAVSILSGLVRGFAGFGSALIYIPLVAAIYEPRISSVTLLLIDLVSSTPYTVPEFRKCTWREVVPISVAMAVAVPLGTLALQVVDPIVLRWFIAVLVLGLLAVLISGWRFGGEPGLPVTVGVGLFAGFGCGAVQIAGPAVIIYWLSRSTSAATMRANLMVFFVFTGVVVVISYLVQGLFSKELIALSVLLGLPYMVALGAGALFFRGATDRFYRNVAYAIITAAALVSLPVFDQVFR
jgi:uncharacterized membrane protein YfcA